MNSVVSARLADQPPSWLRARCPYGRPCRCRGQRGRLAPLACCALCAASFFAAAPRARAQSTVPPERQLTAPVPLQRVQAAYPSDAMAAGVQGTVVVLATLNKAGVVTAAEVVESSNDPALDRSAVEAALQWRFQPALQDGVPIESQVRIPFHFHQAMPRSDAPPMAAVAPAPTGAVPAPAPAPQPAPPPLPPEVKVPNYESNVSGRRAPLQRGSADYHVDIGALSAVPHANASAFLKLAPGILLTSEGGEAHAEQVFMRGFDAREGQDVEFSVDGTPFNESGNLHGNGYADTHFIIPELVSGIRVIEGPYDPRQGNYAVAGSVDYELGLADRGITTQYSYGSFNTDRLLLLWGPQHESEHTFVGVDLYQTSGFGQNRQARHATVMAQYEGQAGRTRYRLAFTGYIASSGSAGLVRADDYRAGRIGFYGTYDPNQGEDVSRYSLTAELESRFEHMTLRNLVFGTIRPFSIRENFTGFILDVQEPQQDPHTQRGDLIDLHNTAYTVGARGSARIAGVAFKQTQELEVGYFARGDFGTSLQQRVQSGANVPYHTDTDLDWSLGDVGLYLDGNLRATRWLAVRGGLRADLFSFDVNDLCAVQTTPDYPALNYPPDTSCLQQQSFGAYREPNQHTTSLGIAYQPRASLILGPLAGLGASVSYGEGARSIDPVYITANNKLQPFATTKSIDAGVNYFHRFKHELSLKASSSFFHTTVSQDLIFSESAGRNILGGPSRRLGDASSVRLTGRIFDVAANLTYVYATFDATAAAPQSLIPYIPELVFRLDAVLFGEVPIRRLHFLGRPIFGSLATGITYVAPRPLPQNQYGDSIFTVDLNARLRWWIFQVGITATNLLDARYKLGVYNYISDFHSQGNYQSLVASQMFSAGPPLMVLGTLAVTLGGGK